ncbi:nucleotide sugar dehydrogenase [Mesoterricola silvestris]|uniref:UDP-N-acetyl-D-glucosamine dehydrogenase n=1 Tax=Mesoterricola silvestris TaxID=2927979 RepID=A0AA48GES8_9BACT|nr:nucleotide sugar dehydrogenase [Mesoterricola silvestris]BDU71216.1 UDP-N-acetyl-D-glucosamine dehydrogenase [Mesoterricola silvestris]
MSTRVAPAHAGELIRKIENRTALVGVVGLGYVGLPLAVEKAKVGFRVVGFDRNASRVASVNMGVNYIDDVRDAELRDLALDHRRLEATSEWARLAEMDAIVICVPTPLTRNLTPDLQFVEAVTREVARRLRPGQFVSLESTTYPGTTEELIKPILESTGLREGEDFHLAFSPERVDPGNKRFTTRNTSKVVGAAGPGSLDVALAFYRQTIVDVVPVTSARVAEMVKVFENTFRAVNIALVNEMAMLCDRMGLDVWEVLDAAGTKPFGIMPFYPGPGVGGHCIPLDPHYLEWKAREFNFNTRFIALAGEINRRMPEFVVAKAMRILSDHGLGLLSARILVLGLAYKKDVADARESPCAEVLGLLAERGARVEYHDSHVPHFGDGRLDLCSVALTADALDMADLVVILTDHSDVDYAFVLRHARLVLDTRNATRGIKADREGLVLL